MPVRPARLFLILATSKGSSSSAGMYSPAGALEKIKLISQPGMDITIKDRAGANYSIEELEALASRIDDAV